MDWLQFAKAFQAGIVGVIGFGGVIIAQVVNGRLARQRDEAALERRRETVTAAVKAELTIFRDAFKRHCQVVWLGVNAA